MQAILISRCLLGETVRYDGATKRLEHPRLEQWLSQQRLIPTCPEMAGGLPCPRPAAEIEQGRGDRVLSQQADVSTRDGHNVSNAFIAGANSALALCRQHDIRFALLKARSPSCGSNAVYDGSFSGQLAVNGIGVTAALLKQHDIAVFDESQIDELAAALMAAERPATQNDSAG